MEVSAYSNEYGILCTIMPEKEPGEYTVTASFRNKTYTIPLPYFANQSSRASKLFLQGACAVIENAVRMDCPDIASHKPDYIDGTTPHGVHYTAVKNNNFYKVEYEQDGVIGQTTYIPQSNYDFLVKQIMEMEISIIVERELTNQRLSDAVRSLS